MGELLRVDQPLDCLVERDTGRDEDGDDDRETGELLAAYRAEKERDCERDRRQRIAEVVDQIGEQRDRPRNDEDRDLRPGGEREHGEAERNSLDAPARTDDRAVYQPMRVTAARGVRVLMLDLNRARSVEEQQMPMRSGI